MKHSEMHQCPYVSSQRHTSNRKGDIGGILEIEIDRCDNTDNTDKQASEGALRSRQHWEHGPT